MYRKRKTILNNAIDNRLMDICYVMHNYNNDSIFAVSKTYLEKDKELEEIKNDNVILVSTPINELVIPERYKLIGNNLKFINTEDTIAVLEYREMSLTNGNICGRYVEDLYLDIKEKRL